MKCIYCGSDFETEKNLSYHMRNCEHFKTYVQENITKEFLLKEYSEKKRTIGDISSSIPGLGTKRIRRMLKMWNIPLNKREWSSDLIDKANEKWSREYLIEEYINKGRSALEISQELGYSSAKMLINRLNEMNISVRGISDSVKTERVVQKRATTNMIRYGGSNPFSRHSSSRLKWEWELYDLYGITNIRQREDVKEKIHQSSMETKYKMGLAIRPELLSDFERYKREVDILTSKVYKECEDIINHKGFNRGRGEYHLDHNVSKHYGFINNVPPEIISHVCNLQMLPENENASKGSKCGMTLNELYKRIEQYEYCDYKKHKKN